MFFMDTLDANRFPLVKKYLLDMARVQEQIDQSFNTGFWELIFAEVSSCEGFESKIREIGRNHDELFHILFEFREAAFLKSNGFSIEFLKEGPDFIARSETDSYCFEVKTLDPSSEIERELLGRSGEDRDNYIWSQIHDRLIRALSNLSHCGKPMHKVIILDANPLPELDFFFKGIMFGQKLSSDGIFQQPGFEDIVCVILNIPLKGLPRRVFSNPRIGNQHSSLYQKYDPLFSP
jgi:hypothetical protein